MHGTWKTTGGGSDSSGVAVVAIVVAAVVIFGGGAVAAITAAVAELLIVIAVIVGVLVLAAAALLAWWVLKGRPAGEAKFEAARLERARAREVERARERALRHQENVEVAAAGRTVIQNVIDPAAMLEMAARVAAGHPWSWDAEPAPVPRREVGR